MKPKSQHAEAGSARIVMLALISFLLGVALTALWFHRAPAGNTGTAVSQTVSGTTTPPPSEPVGVPAPVPTPAPAPANPQPGDPVVIEQVKKAVPNFASISLDDGEQILRAAALKDFAAAEAVSDNQLTRARQQLQNAQNSGSPADQQAAMKNVQDTQTAAAEKLKQTAATLQDQITALKSLKSGQ